MVFTLLYSISYGEFPGKSPLLVPPRWPSKAGSGSKNPVIHRRKSGESCSTQEEKERRIPRVTGGEKERWDPPRNTRGRNNNAAREPHSYSKIPRSTRETKKEESCNTQEEIRGIL